MFTIKSSLSRIQFMHALDDAYHLFRTEQPQDVSGKWPVVYCALIDEFDRREAMLSVVPPSDAAQERTRLGWLSKRIVESATIAFSALHPDTGDAPAFYIQVPYAEPVTATVQLVSDDPLVRKQYDAFCALLALLDASEPEPVEVEEDGMDAEIAEIEDVMQSVIEDEKRFEAGEPVDTGKYSTIQRVAFIALYLNRSQRDSLYSQTDHAARLGLSLGQYRNWERKGRLEKAEWFLQYGKKKN